jgi:uncharacterized protein (TIGR03437 family)
MMKGSRYLIPFAVAALLPGVVCAQSTFDNSGNSLLQGTYFIRQVLYEGFTNDDEIGEAASLTGTISFSGGTYTLNAQVSDDTVSNGTPQPLSTSGNYSVNASGVFAMDDPLSSGDTLYGGVGPSAIVGSATESTTGIDFMVAVPMGASVSNASLKGTYRIVGMDYPQGDVTQVSNYSFLINPDGAGNLNVASLAGHAVNVSDTFFNQSISGATYSLSGATGTLTLPAQSSGTSLISGTKQFFVSADGNILVSGSMSGYDIQVGINVTGAAASTNFGGTYFSGGEDYISGYFAANGTYYLDDFFGSTRAATASGSTSAGADQRIGSDIFNPYDFTFSDQFSLASDGSATDSDSGDLYYVGAGGAARVVVGQSTAYTIELDVQATPLPVTGSVVLSPLGVVNGANYLPITNPVAPGEFLTLFGSGLGPASVAEAALPYPNTLSGVSVSINGTPAPVQLASSGQINCIVPYEISDPFAVVTVTYNGTTSNAVTLYTDTSAPGVFTLDESGTGDAALLHADFSVVSAASPAQVGETLQLFLTGLGTVSPAAQDGVADAVQATTDDTIDVFSDGPQALMPATVTFSGLAPGFAGLYQVNFVVPNTPDTGPVFLDIADENNGAYNSMATLELSTTSASARPKAVQVNTRLRAKSRGKIRSKSKGFENRRVTGFVPRGTN